MQFYGMFHECLWIAILGTLFAGLFLGFFGSPLWLWSAFILLALAGFKAPVLLIALAVLVLLVFNIPVLRQLLVSKIVLSIIQKLKIMPQISETERIALEAGTTWMDGELFSGTPNYRRMMNQKYEKLRYDEQAFIDNQVNKLCAMIDDWTVFQTNDLPKEVWDFLKKEKFFGMIVPKEYGGLGFSALGNSAVVQKVGSHSIPLSIYVMVPNSLGPAELLAHYGTKAQKDYYLPRLADGREIPCFALTEPTAGSDAGAITSSGVLFKDTDGTVKVRLNWEKRYITMAAISTLVGLAVKLRDPDNILGKGEDLGITCILVPSNTPGVKLGERHNPMGVPFFNCPTHGKDVVVSIDQIIGGASGVGKGWQMLMESLSAGRAISLPAQGTGGIKRCLRTASAYANIRRQFGIEIGKFEGIREPLTRLTGFAYLAEAVRTYTCGAVDSGLKPAVVSAIAKYHTSELCRMAANDAMDILGGAGISRGPRNNIANGYIAAPIAITVEGANILTRTMIIFGQGAIRCHPFAYAEVKAVNANNLPDFDRAFWGHIGFVVKNTCRAKLLYLTRGRLAAVGVGNRKTKRYFQKISWASATFSIMSDVAMGAYGGNLKMREQMTGRYADVLSWMYISSAILKRFVSEGCKKEHEPFMHWSMQYSFAQIQKGFDGIFDNLDKPGLSILGKIWGFFFRLNGFGQMPDDRLGNSLCDIISTNMTAREQLTEGMFVPEDPESALGRYEHALKLIIMAENIYGTIRKAMRKGVIPKARIGASIEAALKQKVITQNEADVLAKAEAARLDAIQVDSFDVGDFQTGLLENHSA